MNWNNHGWNHLKTPSIGLYSIRIRESPGFWRRRSLHKIHLDCRDPGQNQRRQRASYMPA